MEREMSGKGERWREKEGESEDESVLVQRRQQRHAALLKTLLPSSNCESLAWVSWEICWDVALNAIKIRTAGRGTGTLAVQEKERDGIFLHSLSRNPPVPVSFFKLVTYCLWWWSFVSGGRAVTHASLDFFVVSVCLWCSVFVAVAIQFFSYLLQANWKHTAHVLHARTFFSLETDQHRPFKTTHVKAFMNRPCNRITTVLNATVLFTLKRLSSKMEIYWY